MRKTQTSLNSTNRDVVNRFLKGELDRIQRTHSPFYPSTNSLDDKLKALMSETSMDYGFEFDVLGALVYDAELEIDVIDEEKFIYFLLCHKGDDK